MDFNGVWSSLLVGAVDDVVIFFIICGCVSQQKRSHRRHASVAPMQWPPDPGWPPHCFIHGVSKKPSIIGQHIKIILNHRSICWDWCISLFIFFCLSASTSKFLAYPRVGFRSPPDERILFQSATGNTLVDYGWLWLIHGWFMGWFMGWLWLIH